MSESSHPYVGNAATYVLHKKRSNRTCRVAEIKPENRENFKTPEQAEGLGYRACKKCVGARPIRPA